MNLLQKGFQNGVECVRPQNLMQKFLAVRNDTIVIGEKSYPANVSCYVVGFGKAVGDMAPVLERTLNTPERRLLKNGIVSVPQGYLSSVSGRYFKSETTKIKYYEGGRSNLPDKPAEDTTKRILDLINSLNEEDLLFVLISGGGSSLLTLPAPPLTLQEKSDIIKSLSLSGASITEMNTVRKAMSLVKGGKLAASTKADVVSFILSDIIDSPLGMIASGPTVFNENSIEEVYYVLNKYKIPLTDHLKKALDSNSLSKLDYNFNKVYNVLIGDNNSALNSIKSYMSDVENFKCIPITLSASVNGQASVIGREMSNLAFQVLKLMSGESESDLDSFADTLNISPSNISHLYNVVKSSAESVCLLFGGETTVDVRGSGKGGRNQELVLSASLQLEQLSIGNRDACGEVVLLSAGTDGIDGPTDAAGAMTYYSKFGENIKLQTEEAKTEGLCPEHFLGNNDSYNYFSRLSNAKYLIKTGHTGTNVMDIQILLISKTKIGDGLIDV